MMLGGKTDSLSVWLKRRGLWVASNSSDDRVVTHVFLDGGKASVTSPEDREAFLEAYARDVVVGRPLHVVERAIGTSYRMFVDIDLPVVVGKADYLTKTIRAALSCAPAALRVGEVSVCTRSALDGKTGAHLVWSDHLRVDDASAKSLRGKWIDALLLRQIDAGFDDEDETGYVDWNKVIDESVYRRNGLRMPWSLKRGGSTVAAYVPTHIATWDATETLQLREWDTPWDHPSPLLEDDVIDRLRRTSIDALDSKGVSAAAAAAAAVSAPAKNAKRRLGSSRGSDADDEADEADQQIRKKKKKPQADVSIDLTAEERIVLYDALPQDLYAGCEVGMRCLRRIEKGCGLTVSCSSRYCQAEMYINIYDIYIYIQYIFNNNIYIL